MEKHAIVFGLVGTNIGGIETFLLNMNDSMHKNFIFDYVIEQNVCIHAERITQKKGIIISIPNRKEHPFLNTIAIYRILSRRKKKLSTAYFNLSSLSWIMPEIIALLLGYKVVIHSHNSMLIDKNSSFKYRLMNKINQHILSLCNVKRLACSEVAGQFLFGKNKKVEIIRNGIYLENYKFSNNIRERVRKNLHISNQIVIGYVGRLAFQKNPLFLLDVYSSIQQKIDNAVLLMVGEGDLKNEIEKKISLMGLEDKVILYGTSDNVCDLYQAMDLFILPSRHEGLGIVLIEAQASGLSCVVSKDVIPQEAFVTDLISSISLDNPAETWADACLKSMELAPSAKRKDYSAIVARAGYGIESEAEKLQNIIFSD